MSYKNDTPKEGQTTVVCDTPKCKNTVVAKGGRGTAYLAAKEEGWLCKSASEHYCATHRPARAKASTNGKTAKAAKASKKKKATMKSKVTKRGPAVFEFGKQAEQTEA